MSTHATMKTQKLIPRLLHGLLAVALVATVGLASAQQKFVRGQGNGDSKEAAVAAAKISAWKNYLGLLQGAKLENVMANEKALLADIDSIVVDVNVVDEKCSSALFSSSCTVSIKAAVNESIVESRLRDQAQAGGDGKATAQDDIAFLVMARMADSQVSFDTKLTKRAESSVGTSGSAASADASASNKTDSADASADAVSVTQSSKTVTGGSQEQKRDRIKYVAWPNIDDLQNRVGETLTNNRISTVLWEELVNNCGVSDNSPFSKMYADSETGQLPGNVRSDIFKKIKECQITKIILASIEVDGYRQDPNTGLWLATGNMNITVYDLSGRFARSIGSANRTFSGRAEKLNDAGREAMTNAAKAAADVVVNQLNLK